MSSDKTLYRGGYIYSPVPDATALLVHNEAIVWVGDDIASQAYVDDQTDIVDLNGAFVAPPFVDCHGASPSVHLDSNLIVVESDDSSSLNDELSSLGDIGSRMIRWDLDGVLDLDALDVLVDYQASNHASVSVCLSPSSGQMAFECAKRGVPLGYGSWGKYTSPWEWIRASQVQDVCLSERAAFNAATRGGVRVMGDPEFEIKGVLNIGYLAEFSIWEAGNVEVRSADPRISAWSTNPSSGTPGLPALVADDLPRLLGEVSQNKQ